jgi:Eukaryotic translation initiation factor 3 subunit 8 N-terminus
MPVHTSLCRCSFCVIWLDGPDRLSKGLPLNHQIIPLRNVPELTCACRYQEKTPEQEKLERRRQMPFHMHINLEMVEGVYLTCAALLEGPNIAAHPLASTRRVISKPFLRLLETYKNQVRD